MSGVQEPVGQVAVVREQQEPLRVAIEASDREDSDVAGEVRRQVGALLLQELRDALDLERRQKQHVGNVIAGDGGGQFGAVLGGGHHIELHRGADFRRPEDR